MEKEKIKSDKDFKRENEYAGEELRIAEILKTRMSEEEASRIIYELEKIAKENDDIVAKILSHPKTIERYDVEAYDGIELRPKPPVEMPVHFIRDGLWLIKNLAANNMFADVFIGKDGKLNEKELLEWFSKDLEFNKLRLFQLEKIGKLMIRDPAKVRIKKVKLSQENEEKKEITH